jgi:type II secretory pathway component PulM
VSIGLDMGKFDKAAAAAAWGRLLRGTANNRARLLQAWTARQPRERKVLLAAMALLSLGAIDMALWTPAAKARQALQAQLTQEEALRSARQQVVEERQRNAARLLAEEEALRARIARADRELADLRRSVTPGPKMLKRLRQFSAFDNRLKLVGLTVEPAEQVTAGTEGLYRLPVVVTVEGDYAAITSYLQKLESDKGGMRWRSLDLQTRDWPVLRLKLRVFTLGEQAAWPV